LAYYVEGKGFYTQKQMPFGLTSAPATFAHVIAEKLGDILPKLEIELLVDDGGMAGDDFESMMKRTRQFFTRVHKSSLSLSAKKSEFFMTNIIFAGSRVGPNGVQSDSTKLTAIVDWRQPITLPWSYWILPRSGKELHEDCATALRPHPRGRHSKGCWESCISCCTQ
jgi:hypothetical protein